MGTSGAAWHELFLAMTLRDARVREVITESTRDFARSPFITARRIAAAV